MSPDYNHCVSAFSRHRHFLKCFGKQGGREREREFDRHKGIAVDNTTGNIYVKLYVIVVTIVLLCTNFLTWNHIFTSKPKKF